MDCIFSCAHWYLSISTRLNRNLNASLSLQNDLFLSTALSFVYEIYQIETSPFLHGNMQVFGNCFPRLCKRGTYLPLTPFAPFASITLLSVSHWFLFGSKRAGCFRAYQGPGGRIAEIDDSGEAGQPSGRLSTGRQPPGRSRSPAPGFRPPRADSIHEPPCAGFIAVPGAGRQARSKLI